MSAKKPLLAVGEAQARILAAIKKIPSEQVALEAALGRVLAEDITAETDQPMVARSAMDGYAVRAADAAAVPARLRVVGAIAAGDTGHVDVAPGTAVRIFTGAPLPPGADAVAIQEDTDTDDCASGEIRVTFAAAPGDNVRPAGNDFRAGAVGLASGETVGPRGIMIAAAMNRATLSVARRPRIALIATGSELVAPGASPAAHETIASSLPALSAAVAHWGGAPLSLGIVPDNTEAIEAALRAALDQGCDLVVTLGGASVGDHDLVQASLSGLGFSLDFWRIAMKPGKPLIFGSLGAVPVIGLPGNPVSSMICALIFLRPAIHKALGRRADPGMDAYGLPRQMAVLSRDLAPNGERADFLRGHLTETADAIPTAEPFSAQDSAQTLALVSARCLIPRTPFAPSAKAGEIYPIVPLARLF